MYSNIKKICKNSYWNENNKPRCTVLTAVYNREKELIRAMESVKAQTCTDIEYIIADDGSTENLETVVQHFMDNVTFPVMYIKCEHGGAHVARNRGKSYARGKYLVTLDSDDEMTPDAIQTLMDNWDSIPQNERGRYWEVVCLCKDQNGKIVGEPFPVDINSLPMEKSYVLAKKLTANTFLWI